MAEFIMKDLVKKASLFSQFEIASAPTRTQEIGNPVYPPARLNLAEHGINCSCKTAQQDYDCYDLLIGMDRSNLHQIYQIGSGYSGDKVHLLMDYTNRPGDIANPWHTQDFDTAWRDIEEGCQDLLSLLTSE